MVNRRMMLSMAGGAAIALVREPAFAQASENERIPLWPGPPPGSTARLVEDVVIARSATPGDVAWTSVGMPVLTVARPIRSNGGAVMLIPGGGYTRVSTRREPGATARQLAEMGFTAFELLYRLPHDGWAAGPDTPLQDAQRAIRVIKAGAGTRWTIDPERVAAIGFSAGGHLAGRLATRWSQVTYPPVDAADTMPARPAAVGTCFAVVTMLDDAAHRESRRQLLGNYAADPVWQRRYSNHIDVPTDSVPTWLTTNVDDRSVPMRNSVLLHEALVAAKVPSELHIFQRGGHGAPLPRASGKPINWLAMFLDWAGDHGLPAARA